MIYILFSFPKLLINILINFDFKKYFQLINNPRSDYFTNIVLKHLTPDKKLIKFIAILSN